ncbi:MAG: hypothetical protein NZM35_06960 [Chitinophagales bacterium]|nr:hypothetical protein [Chitinophagales bacterium]MDW8419094.1 hypothetical protein [Chitinophagales bacterium]
MTKRNVVITLIIIAALTGVVAGAYFLYKRQNTYPVLPPVPVNDTLSNVKVITAPHADTSLIPVLSKVVEEAIKLSEEKNYERLAGLILYRGPDEKRLGTDVFNAANKTEREVIRITAEVLAKWHKGVTSVEYPRVFDIDLPEGRKMTVLEVIFIADKKINRKFFGFMQLHDKYVIADITSYL